MNSLVGRPTRVCILSIFSVLSLSILRAQSTPTISGVINAYSQVLSLDTHYIRLSSTAAFATGDKVLIIQMKGASIIEAEDSTYGDILDFGTAGNYEWNEVANISGDTLFVAYDLCKTYVISGLVQAVRIPVYQSVQVSDSITASAWNGTTGGILAMEVQDTLFLEGKLTARDAGFKGGEFNGSSTSGGLVYHCEVGSGKGGIKGEGIIEIPNAGCRGKLANGGGGGNDHNGGGGGGGNYGAGGQGGDGWRSNTAGKLSDLDKGGRGGLSLGTYYESGSSKLFLGGGGGGGHQNNGAAYPASNGGGIIFLRATALEAGSGAQINASALNAQDISINDGASGGGAGGSILLDVSEFINPSNLSLEVDGGDGASIYTANQHGPGGGGAGGLIQSRTALAAGIRTSAQGGAAGLFISSNTSHIYHNTSHGASAGGAGAVLQNFVLQLCSYPPVLDLDGGFSGFDHVDTLEAGGEVILIGDSASAFLTDLDDLNLESATITLTNGVDGSEESLTIEIDAGTLAAYGITATLSADGHSISLSGTATLAQYQEVITQIGYTHSGPDDYGAIRTIEVSVNDGGTESNVAEANIMLNVAIMSLQWTDLHLRPVKKGLRLRWQVSLPAEKGRFLIEALDQDSTYCQLGSMSSLAHGRESQYEFHLRNPKGNQRNQSVFRIKWVGENGRVAFSPALFWSPPPRPFSMLVYPNPASDALRIEVQSAHEIAVDVQIFAPSGQQIFHGADIRVSAQRALTLPIQDWLPGVYVVQVKHKGQRRIGKIFVR
ncbi:MAG: T9SS type A sorting domain-containing protein [Bacteroidota bacterium]